MVAVDLALTGALHLDGLADTADGLLPHMEQNRRLEVMTEPGVGAFALAAVTAALVVRWAVLADPYIRPVDLIAVWAGSRAIAATIPAVVPTFDQKDWHHRSQRALAAGSLSGCWQSACYWQWKRMVGGGRRHGRTHCGGGCPVACMATHRRLHWRCARRGDHSLGDGSPPRSHCRAMSIKHPPLCDERDL